MARNWIIVLPTLEKSRCSEIPWWWRGPVAAQELSRQWSKYRKIHYVLLIHQHRQLNTSRKHVICRMTKQWSIAKMKVIAPTCTSTCKWKLNISINKSHTMQQYTMPNKHKRFSCKDRCSWLVYYVVEDALAQSINYLVEKCQKMDDRSSIHHIVELQL